MLDNRQSDMAASLRQSLEAIVTARNLILEAVADLSDAEQALSIQVALGVPESMCDTLASVRCLTDECRTMHTTMGYTYSDYLKSLAAEPITHPEPEVGSAATAQGQFAPDTEAILKRNMDNCL